MKLTFIKKGIINFALSFLRYNFLYFKGAYMVLIKDLGTAKVYRKILRKKRKKRFGLFPLSLL